MKKRILSLFLVAIMVLSSLNMAFATTSIPISAPLDVKKITIIHTNDTHARVANGNGSIGMAKIATIIKQAKEKNPNTLVFDAGDTLHGMPIINISKGENAIKILDATGYDLMTIGNHDFNYGQERLKELKGMLKFNMLSANILDSNGKPIFTPYEIKEIDGVKIAIFGLTTPETAYKTSPSNVKGITFADPIEISKKMVAELKDKADIIIALAHIGLDQSSVVTSKAIAEQVNGIDLIIDGHSHTVLKEGLTINNTLIAQTGEYDKNIGFVELEIANGKIVKKEARLMSEADTKEISPDEKVEKLIAQINEENKPALSKVVAKTDIFLDGARENVRAKETNLGNLSADAVRFASKADIGFVNGGNIRISINPGDVTFGDTSSLFPFGNTIKVIEMTAADIKKALENSVSGYPATFGGFLQVSGLTFKFSKDKEVGSRVYELKIGGKLISTTEDWAKKYTVAVNDFLAIGGDNYTVMIGKPVVAEIGTYEEIFAAYLNSNGTKGCEVSGRIVEAPEKKAPEKQPEKTTEQKEDVVYVVVSGDVLWRIAQKFGTTWQKLAEYNKLANPHLILVNQKLRIPAK
jgi:5'-nucleotidase/UDP-sugar diphosphatase